ncbi:MAG: LamG domain-containing protein [Hyphomicrobiales bacterium]|nr:MAG: LamG domain-containing protein [Hyphomicrobiales bacterium]
MAARYWRVIGMRTAGAGLALTQAALWSGAGVVAAALSASHPPVAGTVETLTDGVLDDATLWPQQEVRAPGFALLWDAGQAVDVVNVRFGGAPSAAQWVRVYTLQSSADGLAWTTVGTYVSDWPGDGVLAPLPATEDNFAAFVVSRLMFDGSLTDTEAVVWAPSGGAAVSIGNGIGGSGALALNGSTDCYIATSASDRFAFGVGDFCVELYVHWNGQGAEQALMCMRDASLSIWSNVLRLNGGAVQWSNGSAWLGGSSPIPSGQWVHIALTRGAGTLRIFVNGAKVFEGADTTDIAGNRPCYIGAYDAFRGATQLTGLVDFVRVTKGAARYTAEFQPPVGVGGGGSFPPGAIPAPVPVILGSTHGGASQLLPASAERLAKDMQFGGPGRIWGTTKTKGTSANVPTKARVVLLHQRSKLPVRETWSDPATGAFEFVGMDTRQDFLTLAEDAGGSFRPVAASRLVPEVQP